jgi:hypothetical protein
VTTEISEKRRREDLGFKMFHTHNSRKEENLRHFILIVALFRAFDGSLTSDKNVFNLDTATTSELTGAYQKCYLNQCIPSDKSEALK